MELSLSLLVYCLSIIQCLVIGEQFNVSQISPEELECLANEKVYFQGGCYKLTRVKPCKHGQWLVLDKSKIGTQGKDVISPVCQNIPCEGELIYWAKTNSCLKVEDVDKVCKTSVGTELKTNNFGEGECRCKTQRAHARRGRDESGPCYPLYHRGTCPIGMVFAFPPNKTHGAQCIADVCYEESMKRKREKLMDENGALAPWTDGLCYELEKKGPCPEGTFMIPASTQVPSCVSTTNQLLKFEKPQDCFTDQKGECQTRVIINNKQENAAEYWKDLYSSINSLRRRRWTDMKRKQRSQEQ